MNGEKIIFHRMDKIFGTLNKISRRILYLENITQFFFIGLILLNYFLTEIAGIFTSWGQIRFRRRDKLLKGRDIGGIDNME
jgi:hypothetical protein